MKKCTRCNVEKESDKFSKDKSKKDNLRYLCKDCENQYYENNKEDTAEHRKQYNEEHKEEKAEWWKKYYEDNKEKIIKRTTYNTAKKLKNDFAFRLLHNIRSRFKGWLNGNKKSKRTFEYLDCTKEELVAHLESQFQEGMTWDNYGLWHIDHIRPLSSFDPTKEEDLYEAWRKENLQPLWAIDNLKKSNRHD